MKTTKKVAVTSTARDGRRLLDEIEKIPVAQLLAEYDPAEPLLCERCRALTLRDLRIARLMARGNARVSLEVQ